MKPNKNLLPHKKETKNKMLQIFRHLPFHCLFFSFFIFMATLSSPTILVPIGQVLDSTSLDGGSSDVCMSLALSDFYSLHSNYKTRLYPFKRNYADVVGAVSSALDLVKNVGVHAIVGPQGSSEASFLAELGEKANVPVISFIATSPSLSPSSRNPFFIRAAPHDSFQVKAVTDLLQGFEWYDVVLVFEDTEFGNRFVPPITDALQESNVRIARKLSVSASDNDSQILKELEVSKKMWTRVFLVHMSPSFGSRFFVLADQAGMMKEGYAWITTEGMSISLDALDPKVINSMQGVLALRPYVPHSEKLHKFTAEWRKNLSTTAPIIATNRKPNVHCLWAYDTIWALAMAAERIEPISNSSFLNTSTNSSSGTDLLHLKISKIGTKLRNEIANVKFNGLSGEFNLSGGQLQPSMIEIINVRDQGISLVGYWSPDYGISREITSPGKPATYSTSINKLKSIIWPGDSISTPKGWETISITDGNVLKVGVPCKGGFPEFVNVSENTSIQEYNFTGFSIEFFKLVWANLTYKVSYEFKAFRNPAGEGASYDELVNSLRNKTYDLVVGDITIRANRTRYAEFTVPYSESGVIMLVKKGQPRNKDMWIFVRPLSWDLWLTIILICMFVGASIIILERNVNNNELGGSVRRKVGMSFWLPFQAMVIPQRDLVVKSCSRFVLVMWLFLAFVLMQSYTANLSSILVVDQLKPSYPSVKDLRDKGSPVGYQTGSFVEDFLVNELGFDRSKIKGYANISEYCKALSDGPANGGVAAIFDEIPYLKLFVAKYGCCTMSGPRYMTAGFGFAFPIGSPLVADFSKAILNVVERKNMTRLTKKYFGEHFEDGGIDLEDGTPSLTTKSFGGLFLVVGILTVTAIIMSETYILKRLKHVFGKISSHHSESSEPSPNGAEAASTDTLAEGNGNTGAEAASTDTPAGNGTTGAEAASTDTTVEAMVLVVSPDSTT